MKDYLSNAQRTKEKLNDISPSMCMAKWLQVSLHLPQGLTQSCYHPPTHKIPLSELKNNPKALHNTQEKALQRKEMLEGKRPAGCSYCWKLEDQGDLSDRHYRSGEEWVGTDGWNEVLEGSWDENINPRYVEVNFNQACNFKCTYCSPHLSTEWEKEIDDHGAFHLTDFVHNDKEHLDKIGLMPIKGAAKENPYVEAFWKWWPDLYSDLKVFRMTGGEPLMDKNTFKVLKYVNDNPNQDIEISITSNMCPPQPKLFDKFVEHLQEIETTRIWEDKNKINPYTDNNFFVAPAIKHFNLFVSFDSVGEQAEYIRTGMDYDVVLKNTKRILSETTGTSVTFINTFNLLSIPRIQQYLQMILDLRVEFGFDNQNIVNDSPIDETGKHRGPFVRYQRQRIYFDIPYLRQPTWMSAQNIYYIPEVIKYMEDAVEFMESNRAKEDYDTTFHGFLDHEIEKVKRDIAWIKSGAESISEDELQLRQKQFWEYFNQIDHRRNTNFIEVFPELSGWWNDCYTSS